MTVETVSIADLKAREVGIGSLPSKRKSDWYGRTESDGFGDAERAFIQIARRSYRKAVERAHPDIDPEDVRLESVSADSVRITASLLDMARDTCEDPEHIGQSSFREQSQIDEDTLFGRAAEIAAEELVLGEYFDEDEYERYNGSGFDYVLWPDTLREVTVDVKCRFLPRQVEKGTVDPDGRDFPWYTDLLVRQPSGPDLSAAVFIQMVMTETRFYATGWAKARDLDREGEVQWHIENNPLGLPMQRLRPFSEFKGGAS